MYKFQFQKYFFLNVQTECLYIIQDCTKFPLLHYIGETSPLDSMKKGLIIPVPSSLIRKGLHECLNKCIIKQLKWMQDSVDHYVQKTFLVEKLDWHFPKGFNRKFGKYTLLSGKVTGMTSISIIIKMRLSVSQIMAHQKILITFWRNKRILNKSAL